MRKKTFTFTHFCEGMFWAGLAFCCDCEKMLPRLHGAISLYSRRLLSAGKFKQSKMSTCAFRKFSWFIHGTTEVVGSKRWETNSKGYLYNTDFHIPAPFRWAHRLIGATSWSCCESHQQSSFHSRGRSFLLLLCLDQHGLLPFFVQVLVLTWLQASQALVEHVCRRVSLLCVRSQGPDLHQQLDPTECWDICKQHILSMHVSQRRSA